MNRKLMAIILLVLALGVLGYWFADGKHIYNVEQVQVEKVDPLFGTKTVEWQNEFHPGLLGYTGPVIGVLLVASLALFVMGRKSARTEASS